MKTNRTYPQAILTGTILFVLLVIQTAAFGQKEMSKRIQKSFDVNPDVTVSLVNKFGNIRITTDSVDKVTIDVIITVKGRNQERLQSQLDNISIKISGSKTNVSAETVISKSTKNNIKLEINYKVRMPVSGNLKVTNSFGEVILNNLDGSSLVNVSYGAFYARKLNNKDNDVTVKFGKATIDYALYLTLNSSYSDVAVKRVKLLHLTSKYGNASVDAAGRIHLTSAYDVVSLGAVAELFAESKFSGLEVETITQKLKLNVKYGGVEIAFISKNFKNVDIDVQYADVELTFEGYSDFYLDSKVSYGEIDLPSNMEVIVSKNNQETSYSGASGEGNPKSVVRLRAKYANIEVDFD